MTLSIESNLITKPVQPVRNDLTKITNPTRGDSPGNNEEQTVVTSNEFQTLSINVPSNLALVENNLYKQDLGQNTTEGIAEILDPSEILDWTDDVPPIEIEFEGVPLDTNRKVDSIGYDPNGAGEQETRDERNKANEVESTDEEIVEELLHGS